VLISGIIRQPPLHWVLLYVKPRYILHVMKCYDNLMPVVVMFVIVVIFLVSNPCALAPKHGV
jgi:hypothetical protein